MITEVFIAVDRNEVYRATLPPGEYVIGRDPDAQIRIDHPTVSRRHAKLVVEEDHLELADLDSGNGTLIEETPLVGPSHFYEGQTARLGDVLLRARQNVTPEVLPPSIGNYRRGDMVAAGGMGAIHEARQSAMGRKVAMKVMLREESESGLRRFINEARITGMLEHPNIVPVHELGVDAEGRAFDTMKFVHGTTLAEVLAGVLTGNREAVQKYPLSFLLTVFQKVCDAIAFAHSRGIHHRDLKPENVMIGDFGEVLVMDWGLSKEVGFASEAEDILPGSQSSDGTGWRTMDGSVLGTPAYMSPEQARGEINAVDARSDIYALGAILHEILYLQSPVSGSSAYDIVDKVARGELDAIRGFKRPHLPGGKVPPSLEAVRRKAMAYDPGWRYQRVTDLQADIAAYQSGFATSAEGAGLGKHLVLFFNRHKGVSMAVLGGFLLLAGLSTWYLRSVWAEQSRVQEARRIAEENKHEREQKEKENQKLVAEKRQTEELLDRESTEKEAVQARAQEAQMSAEELTKLMEQRERDLAEDAPVLADLARRAVATGRGAEAERLSGFAVKYSPDDANLLTQHGRILLARGRFGEAEQAFKRAQQSDPRAPVADKLAAIDGFRSSVGPERRATAETFAQLERFLMRNGLASHVRLVGAAGEGVGERGDDAVTGPELVKKRLGSLAKQRAWRDERIAAAPGGGYGVDLRGLDFGALPDLVDTDVTELDLRDTPVRDIASLRGMSLRVLRLRGTPVTDLTPLRNMPELREVDGPEGISDLSPLQGAPLEVLDLSGSRVVDLEPLREARLRVLRVNRCAIASFEPVAAQPIEELAAAVDKGVDFAPIERMSRLRELELPHHADAIDASRLPDLEKVIHPRLRAAGAMTGDEYRQMEQLRQGLWERYRPELERAGARNLEPRRLTVRETSGVFDLDLRGTDIPDLRRLRTMPVQRLWLDTAKTQLDLGPLAAHSYLQHLSLEGAYAPSVAPLAEGRELKSLVLSRDATDTALLLANKSLERLGYTSSVDGLTASGTKAQFFAPREPDETTAASPKDAPRQFFAFDDPAKAADGWRVNDRSRRSPSAIWTADPVSEGGRGGGHLTFYEREGSGDTAYFVAPSALGTTKRMVYGGLLEFQLRVGREVKDKERVVVVLEGDSTQLHHTSTLGPRVEWRIFAVPLAVEGRWTLGWPQGATASENDIRRVLAKLESVSIRAEYTTDNLDERTDLDDVRLWDEKTARDRSAQLDGQPR